MKRLSSYYFIFLGMTLLYPNQNTKMSPNYISHQSFNNTIVEISHQPGKPAKQFDKESPLFFIPAHFKIK